MSDYPRVVSMSYTIASELPKRWDLSRLEPMSVHLGDFDCALSSGVLSVEPKIRYVDEDAARAALEPLLAGWEALIELEARAPVRFHFRGSTVMKQRERGTVGGELGISAGAGASVEGYATEFPTELPAPTARFVEAPELRLLRERIRDCRLGRDRLLAVGAYATDVFTTRFGGKAELSRQMRVEDAVVKTLKTLTGNRVHPRHGRKGLANLPQLTEAEAEWVSAAVIALARRMGELDAGARPPLLAMVDLPPLSH